jgi:F0F1-type ATP synthase assembly protein I
MAGTNRDRRPPFVVAADLGYQAMSVGILMALPAGVGYWGDSRLGTSPVLVILGAVVGLIAGITQLLRLVGGTSKENKKKDDSDVAGD